MRAQSVLCSILMVLASRASLAQERLQSSDLLKLRSVSAVEVSPDATRVAYTVENNDGNGRPYGQLWVMTLADGKTTRFGGEKEPSGNPTWSPDSQWIAYRGRVGDKAGLVIAHPDGSGARFLAEMSGTNSPLPTTGKTVAWSPDGKRIAFVSSVPGRKPLMPPAIRSSSPAISTSPMPPRATRDSTTTAACTSSWWTSRPGASIS